MTSHLDSHMTTDVKPDMLSGVQTGNGIPHDRYNICGIAHVCTNRKDKIFMQRQQDNYLNFDEAHMALGKFPLFFPCMLPTLLCGIFEWICRKVHKIKEIKKGHKCIPINHFEAQKL